MFYIFYRLEFYALKSKEDMLEEFAQGFWSVVPQKHIMGFTIAEFEMIFNGLNLIDIDDWQYNTIYQDGYHKKHKNIIWFWEILKTYTQK